MKKSHKSYEQVYDGDWTYPIQKNYKEACCHCGLTHKQNYRVRNGYVEVQVFQDKRATAMIRRHMTPEQWEPLLKYLRKQGLCK